MIVNIQRGVFGDELKNGDMLGVANVVAHLRKQQPDIKFHMMPGSVSSVGFIQEFYKFLLENTDYFSETPGEQFLSWRRVNLWDFRDMIGDNVVIPNNKEMKKKIVIFPIFDAPYNTYRNWPRDLLKSLIEKYSTEEYKDYTKIVCSKDESYFGEEWINSTNFMDNINHIMDAEIFIGGDTGTSHFAWSLDRGPKTLLYYNSGRGMMHCLPFYLLEGKGKVVKYWLDFEGTTWN